MTSDVPIPQEENLKNELDVKHMGNSDMQENNERPHISEEENDAQINTQNIDAKEVSDPDLTKSQSSQIADNEARLEQLEKEHETLKSQYMRIAADFDNFRKRQTRDNDDLRIQLTCNTLSEILPVIDNFERARQQLTPEGEEAQNLHRSYQGLYKQLVEVLKKLGVAPMRVVGQKFDPSLHEAVMREPSDVHQEDIITEELQRGYHLDGRVIRHALVKVSMGPGTSSEDSDNSEEVSNPTDNGSVLESDISKDEN
tara:strand:- start:143 stop:910 length:768 start_codon:yes stop_codon:yes gene_type:complete